MSTEEPAANEILLGLLNRVAAGEFDLDGSFHRFVAKEVYPLLGQAKLTTADLVTLTRQFAARNNPYTRSLATIAP